MTSDDRTEPGRPSPFGSEEEFLEVLSRMTGDLAPRVFALYEVYGEREDARPITWGVAFDDHAELIGDPKVRGTFESAEAVRLVLGYGRDTRLVWASPPERGGLADAAGTPG